MDVIKEGKISNRFQKIPEYFSGKRDDFLKLIPVSCRRILDVGCGSAEGWKNHPAEVCGIEINEEAATKARKLLKQVVSGDIENIELPFAKGSFDCLVFADVLEHLYDPWGMLLKLRPLLAPGGHILISIPNVRHYRVLRSLLFKGEFAYQESGILDIDHVRFFTRKEIQAMLEQTGFEVVLQKRKLNASGKYKFLNFILFGLPVDFLTEQFYILARCHSGVSHEEI